MSKLDVQGASHGCVLAPEFLLDHTPFLELCGPRQAHGLLTQAFVAASSETERWKLCCASVGLNEQVARELSPRAGISWKQLHEELARSLSQLEHSPIDWANVRQEVTSVAHTLSRFESLPSLTWPAFKRLALLLDRSEAREVTWDGSVPVVHHALRTLQRFPDQAGLVVTVMKCLVLLGRPAGGTEGGAVLTNTRASPLASFGSNGSGVKALLACMKQRPDHAELQAAGCWSMVNLALIKPQKKHLLLKGGVDCITAAMRNHSSDREVQFRALFALINLVTPKYAGGLAGGGVLSAALLSDVMSLTVTAMCTFKEDEQVVNRSVLVLHNIAIDETQWPALVGARSALEDAVAANPGDKTLQQCGGSTIAKLAHYQETNVPAAEVTAETEEEEEESGLAVQAVPVVPRARVLKVPIVPVKPPQLPDAVSYAGAARGLTKDEEEREAAKRSFAPQAVITLYPLHF
ncbi:unnamed protein product [Chrysoparadoxa australica]